MLASPASLPLSLWLLRLKLQQHMPQRASSAGEQERDGEYCLCLRLSVCVCQSLCAPFDELIHEGTALCSVSQEEALSLSPCLPPFASLVCEFLTNRLRKTREAGRESLITCGLYLLLLPSLLLLLSALCLSFSMRRQLLSRRSALSFHQLILSLKRERRQQITRLFACLRDAQVSGPALASLSGSRQAKNSERDSDLSIDEAE